MTKRADRDQQIQSYIDSKQTPWQRMYEEYKSNTATLKKEYSPLLKREIISKQSKDSDSLANIFKNIAEDNINLAKSVDTNPSLKLYHYNDGAIACQYTLKLTNDSNLQRDTYKILDTIQTDVVAFSEGDASKVKPINSQEDIEILSNRKELQDIRYQTRKCLKKIEEHRISTKNELYIQESAQVFKDIASGMQRYLEELYKSGENILGPPPCDYTVLGLGSMALRQMTPYSDLECAILTANEDYKHYDNPAAIRNYFTNLSHLVHFKIINLGETIIPTSAYNINLSEFVSPAVNFDLGGKTPLGRIEKDKPYELIQTVDGMLSYLKNLGKTTDHVDKNLASILQKVCFIYGSEELAKSYQKKAQDFLLSLNDKGRTHHEERAIKALLEGVEEIDYTKSTLQPKKIGGNLEQFSLNANKTTAGQLFDVKQEIYRMPDRFIYNLGMIHGVQAESSWDTIDELRERGIINSEGADNLKKALSFATNLRLKTYSHYGCQKDSMDFAKTYERQSGLQSQEVAKEQNKELAQVFRMTHQDLQEDGALFQYYYTALALRKKLKEFCKLDDHTQKEGFFKNNVFYSDDVGTKEQINSRLLRYEDALKWQLEELNVRKEILGEDHIKLAHILSNIGNTYLALSNYNNASNSYKEALKIYQKSLISPFKIAKILDSIGGTYIALGKYNEAMKSFKEALEIRKKSLKDDHLCIAVSYANIGPAYSGLGNHKEALEYMKKAREIYEKYPDYKAYLAPLLDLMGGTYEALGKYNEGLVYKTQGLQIFRELLGEEHPHVAQSLNNIGYTYGSLGKHQEALEYMIKALKIRKKSLGDNHPAVATSLHNIGYIYSLLDDHTKALKYMKKALVVGQQSLDSDYPDNIICKNNILKEYCHLGMYQEALAELAGVLAVYKESNQQDKIAQCQGQIVHIKEIKNIYEEANKLLKDNSNSIVSGKNYKETAKVVNNLNTALNQLKECNHFKKSDVIDRKIMQTLDLLIKAQTSLYQNSTKNKLAIRKQLNDYQKEYETLKKSIEDKQLKLQEIEEYLAAQKQIRDTQSDKESANNTLEIIETNSLLEEVPENLELVSLTGENHNEHAALNLN